MERKYLQASGGTHPPLPSSGTNIKLQVHGIYLAVQVHEPGFYAKIVMQENSLLYSAAHSRGRTNSNSNFNFEVKRYLLCNQHNMATCLLIFVKCITTPAKQQCMFFGLFSKFGNHNQVDLH